MKNVLLSILLLLMTLTGSSQHMFGDTAGKTRFSGFQPGKFNYGLSIGSQFSTMQGYGSGLTSYVTPSISYDVSKRFRIGGGISYSNTNYFDVKPVFGGEQSTGSSGNYSMGMIYVNGTYLMTNRLTITGSAFKIFPIGGAPLPYNPFSPISSDGAQGVNLNVGYTIGKNFHIQAGFSYSSGINPYYGSGYYQTPFPMGTGSGFGFGPTTPHRW